MHASPAHRIDSHTHAPVEYGSIGTSVSRLEGARSKYTPRHDVEWTTGSTYLFTEVDAAAAIVLLLVPAECGRREADVGADDRSDERTSSSAGGLASDVALFLAAILDRDFGRAWLEAPVECALLATVLATLLLRLLGPELVCDVATFRVCGSSPLRAGLALGPPITTAASASARFF